MKSLLHGGFTTTFMHLVLQMAAFALSQRLILTIIIESFSIDQGGGVMFVFRCEKTLCKSSGQRKRRKFRCGMASCGNIRTPLPLFCKRGWIDDEEFFSL